LKTLAPGGPLTAHRPARRPTLAYVADYLFDSFQRTLWANALRAAQDAGVNLLCYLGGTLGPTDPVTGRYRGRNAVFDLVGPATVDGVIVLGGAVNCFAEPAAREALLARWAPLPVLNLASRVEGVPSLLVDNEAGVHALMDHLVLQHGRRRIAFIRGPASSPDAEARYRAYRDALERHGLPFDPAYTWAGDFTREAGVRAVQAFLDERRLPLDALVAASDYMALFAMAELGRRGVAVPRQIVVAGFDDILEAAMASPPLTTVRQPFELMGRRAVERMLALVRGEPVPAVELLPTQLVTRQSCGCHPAAADWPAWSGTTPPPTLPTADLLAAAMSAAAPEMSVRLASPGWARELAEAILQVVSGAPPRAFLEALDAALAAATSCGVDPDRFRSVLHAAFRGARSACPDAETALRLTGVAEASLAVVSGVATHCQVALRLRTENEQATLGRIFQPPNLSEEHFRAALLEGLPTLGVRSFLLSRYRDASLDVAEVWARLDADGLLPPLPPGPYPARELAPGGFRLDGPHVHAVLPIHYVDECIGFAVCQLGTVGTSTVETMSTQLGTSFKVFELMAEVRRYAGQLEQKVEDRTRQLREAQARLLETVHQAGMAEVAVGVLHNVGNLLTSVSVAAEQIADRVDGPHLDALVRVRDLLGQRRDDLGAFFSTDPRAAYVPEYLARVADGLLQDRDRSRAEAVELLDRIKVIRDTIRTLQDLARQGPYSVLRDRLDVPAVIDAALAIQAPALLREGVRVDRWVSAALPALVTERPKLIHVLVNLVKNAVEAMRQTPPDARRLTLRVEPDGPERVRFEVADTGEGIPAENLEKIFAYGFTTKADGHGFGLHTCALYAGQLGGGLTARSAGPGQGATFTLVLPASPTPASS
jgi:DNA-binding LacI/PurR family transcriptional regulator/signal transduction histidine kinase